jgi:hypothetical protein
MKQSLHKRWKHQRTMLILPRLKDRRVAMTVPSVQIRAKTKIPVSVYPCYVIASSHVHEAHLSIICLNMFVKTIHHFIFSCLPKGSRLKNSHINELPRQLSKNGMEVMLMKTKVQVEQKKSKVKKTL